MSEEVPFEITPLAKSKVIRNRIIPGVHYTNQDYWSILGRTLELIKHNYGKDFNEFSESSLGIMLIEVWAFIADQLSFKIDQIANELFVDTVTEPVNAMRLANLVGFRPTPPLPARALFSLALSHPLTQDLPIQAPILISFIAADGSGEKTMELFAADHNHNPIYGQPIIVPAGHMATNAVVGIEGRTEHHSADATGQPWQNIHITTGRVLWGSVKVTIDGTPWREVEFFSESAPRQEFRVEYASDYKAVIFFGNGRSGLIPPKGSTINIAYRYGGGTAGNIVSGAINQTVHVHTDVGSMMTCVVQNYSRGEGGYDGDTIEDVRTKLPLYLKTQNRAVTGGDYKALVDTFATPTNGLVGKSVAVLRNHGCAGNIVDIYITARDGDLGLIKASDNLKKELGDELVRKKMFTDHVCIRDGDIVQVDVHIDATLDRVHRSSDASIKERAYRRMGNFFSLANWEYGQSLRDSDIVRALADIKEFEQIDVTFTTVKSLEEGEGNTYFVPTKFNEIIRPDNLVVNLSYK